MKSDNSIITDKPKISPKEDLLSRNKFADHITEILINLCNTPNKDSVVFALYGK